MDYKKEIINRINGLSGSRSPYEIFSDWVKLMALAIQNASFPFRHDTLWQKREEQYLKIIEPYKRKESVFQEMYALLALLLEENLTDALGEIYMEAGLGNKNTGQFFTPFHVSCACAKLALEGWDGKKKISLNEPSCGGGGMVISVAKILQDRGINYQRYLQVVAQDLDWKAVYMCYVQLSLLGIDAVVAQGDTLLNPYIPGKTSPECPFYTPKYLGLIL